VERFLTDDQLIHEATACAAEIRTRTGVARLRAEQGLTETMAALGDVLALAGSGGGAGVRGGSAAELEHDLAGHEALLDEFVVAIAHTTASQVALERRAQAHTTEVHTISRTMARAAGSSRLVAINALINANALENGQATLAALAQEMQQLSGVVQRSSADVDDIANRLGRILPALHACVSHIATATTQFADDVGAERDRIRLGVEDLDRAMAKGETADDGFAHHGVALTDALSFGGTVAGCLDILDQTADLIEAAVADPVAC
jgi:hypothetical protein